MKITWKITKKRGNWRPILEYHCYKEQWEIDLAVPQVAVESTIPVPNDSCRPKRFVKDRQELHPKGRMYTLHSPGSGQQYYTASHFLPWRPGTNPEYPEVEESMQTLREEYEEALREACDSGPLETSGNLEMSAETKRCVAPSVTAERISRSVPK